MNTKGKIELTDSEGHESFDVVVVGGGNAGFVAAHAARERGRSVLLLEKGTAESAGGNSFYTAGATRIAHRGLSDLLEIVEPDPRHERTEVPAYPAEEYASDMERLTNGRNDPELTSILVNEGYDTLRWLKSLGVHYRLMYERQAYENADGTFTFWGGLHVGNVDGGQGLIRDYTRIAQETGIEIRYSVRATELVVDGGDTPGVRGVRGVDSESGELFEVRASSVILAAGGFEANAAMRREHLGAGWEAAKVRGTPHNTGDMLTAALAIGAQRGGDWSTAHSVQWDAFAHPNESNRELTNRLTRQSYPLGIIVNNEGKRFLDEGADFRNYTYARYGGVILKQPQSLAFQLFDAQLRPLLRSEEYEMPGVSETVADSIEELASAVGMPPDVLAETVSEFNREINAGAAFDPTIKDGRSSRVDPPKSNWAAAIDTPPYYAYAVTCGITFTFGGLKSDRNGRVLNTAGEAIPGLFVCGEMLGGLFSENYPGGSGLTAGMVFGRRAGKVA